MIIEVLQELGIAKNEAKIYETLLKFGQLGVSTISSKAQINRRNVYDSLNRLIEKGLIFEIRHIRDNQYKAVDPQKLSELISRKREKLESIFPELNRMYKGLVTDDEVYIYKGIEGWKNYLSDLLTEENDVFTIGGKGVLTDGRLEDFMSKFWKEAKERDITFHMLYDWEVREKSHKVLSINDVKYKFLPKEVSSTSLVESFGDKVVHFSGLTLGKFDEHSSITIIVNKEIADGHRKRFELLWNLLPDARI